MDALRLLLGLLIILFGMYLGWRYMRWIVLMLLVTIILAGGSMGCASLIVRDGDGVGKKAGKVVVRTFLCGLTYCASESVIAEEKLVEQEQAYLAAQVGYLTYDEALNALGPPISLAEGSTVRTAVWITNFTSLSSGVRHRMQLNFDRSTNQLITWQFE